ncbi:amidase [Kribbella sancticallisti]|uniref:Amidase n=1 Tax=Kribbella sancticallisti TaxID=460087 RepID=A0ABN2CY18_9ACTN
MRSLEQIAAQVRAGELDPVELVEQALRRAEETSGLNAVVHLDAEGARRAAKQARHGPLAGVPVLVKEIIEVEGMPYRCGSAAMDGIAGRDAEVVSRLRAAGAVIIGLSHSHEFAYGCTGTSNRVGPCRNPHDRSRMTGGSSSGAGAAVAAGVVPLAIGTDTAGSVRIPAALCGVVGYKPARDTLPVDGVFPLSQSQDHVGVLTRTVADAVYAVNALTGGTTATVDRPRLGLASNPEYLDYDEEVGKAWSQAMELFETTPVELPDWAATLKTAVDLQGPEAVANHAGRAIATYQPDVQQRLRDAAEVPAWRYVQAQAEAADLTIAFGDLLQTVDGVLLPTVPVVAPLLESLVDEAAVRAQLMRHTRLTNVTGFPAVSIPLPTAGLPVGLQIIARDNQTAGAVAAWIERQL